MVPNLAVILGLEAWDLAMQIALTIGIVVSIPMLILAIFSQPGEIRMSPQREAALATGHSDRATVFEKPFLRPVMWLMLAMAHRLAVPKIKEWLRKHLMISSNPNYYTPEEYLALAIFMGMVLGAALTVLRLLAFGEFSLGLLAVGLFVGVMLILSQLYLRSMERIRNITMRVPYALDLISLAMGAGATFVEAVRTVAREQGDDPFNIELNALLTEIDLGATRRRALENLALRVPVDALKSVIASVIQAEELGTPLSDVLHAQATLMRQQRSVRAENAAAVASVRILVPSLLILMSVVLMLFAPAIVRYIQQGGFF